VELLEHRGVADRGGHRSLLTLVHRVDVSGDIVRIDYLSVSLGGRVAGVLGNLGRGGESWFLRVLLIGLIMTTSLQAIRPMASYKALALGAGPAEVGLVAAFFALLSLLVAVPIGRWVDRIGETGFIVAGSGLMAVVAAGMSVIPSIPLLAASQAFLGLGHIAMVVGMQTLIANRGDAAGRDGRYGAFAVVVALGQLIGPAAGGLLAGRAGQGPPRTDDVFLAAAIAAALGSMTAVTLWRTRRHRPVESGPRPPQEPIPTALRRLLAVPSMPQAMLASITVLSSVNILIAYLPVYGEATGLSVEIVGLLLAVRAGASMVSRALIAPMRRFLGRRDLLVTCMVVPAVVLIVMSFTAAIPALLVAMVLAGFGLGLGQPLTLSWVAGQAPEDLRGTAVAARLGGNRVGQFVLPAAVGLVAGIAGVGAVFWALGLLLGAGAVFVRTGPFVEDAPAPPVRPPA
jgi:MFS family permease